MSLPINGRVAIIDDQIEQALPLINVLSKKQCPYLYYSGDVKFLPDQGECNNDIRLLFLDINLIDNAVHPEKELKGRLIPVLSRVISEDNYPYVLVYWSRNEAEYADLVKDIFDNELPNRKPILYFSQNKLNYFELDGERSINYDENVASLFENISEKIKQQSSYSYLLHWENQVHKSADHTLQKVFSAHSTFPNWSDNANFLMTKFGKSYSGKAYKEQNPEEKIKSCYQAFNNVFIDLLGYYSSNEQINDCIELEYDESNVNHQAISSINKNLLVSEEKGPIEYSGAITQDTNQKSDVVFMELLNNSINRSIIFADIKNDPDNNGKDEKALSRLADKSSKALRASIKASCKKIYCVVTPLCDYVQEKNANSRVVKGLLLEATYRKFIDEKSEAIFISPIFKYEEIDCILVLHFRYFFTAITSRGVKDLKPLFRIRLQLLAEIQSKLARHISRQGILFLD